MDAATAYRTAAKKAPNLLTAIQKIERDALKAMQTEGYGFNQLHTALQESRYPLLVEDRDAVNEYFREILPDDASPETNFNLPTSPARFNMHYEKPLRQIAGILEAADRKILFGMQEEHLPRTEVREAYLGGSLYRLLAGDTDEGMRFEHRVWQSHRAQIMQQVDEETANMRALFQEHLQKSSKEADSPVALREGTAVMHFLRASNAQEETAAALLMEATAYTGRDKETYAKKIAASAIRTVGAYQNIAAAPKEPERDADVYRVCLKDAMRTLRCETLPYDIEAQIAKTLLEAGMEESILREGILNASPLLSAAGRDKDKVLDALLTEKEEDATFLFEDYVSYTDIYCRLLIDEDDALIAEGASIGVISDRRHYNILAARQLLTRYGASAAEAKEVLSFCGGIKETERTTEYLDQLIFEAQQPAAPPTITLPKNKEPVPTQEQEPVWEKPPLPVMQAARVRAFPTDKRGIRVAKQKLRTYVFTDERVRTRSDRDAAQMYEMCCDVIMQEIPLPFNAQMDEQIIGHLFSLGYEAHEIENAVQHTSPRRQSQKNYAEHIVKCVKEKSPAFKDPNDVR